MSTNSNIGIINKDGTVEVIYCHWDGHPSHNGVLLREHYNSLTKVTELIALGNISSLRERVAPEPGQQHSFDSPAEGVTIAYARDRGEAGEGARKYESIEDYWRAEGSDPCIEYVYMFDTKRLKWTLMLWDGTKPYTKILYKKDCKDK